MTNNELINLLRKFPPEDEVYVFVNEKVKAIIGVSHDGVEQGCHFIDVE